MFVVFSQSAGVDLLATAPQLRTTIITMISSMRCGFLTGGPAGTDSSPLYGPLQLEVDLDKFLAMPFEVTGMDMRTDGSNRRAPERFTEAA